MFDSLKSQPRTDFEVRNPEAARAYAIRENRKTIKKFLLVKGATLVVVCTAAWIIDKNARND